MSNCYNLTFILVLLVTSQLKLCYSSNDYYVRIANNGPVVLGANITFTAEVLDRYGRKPSGQLRFVWVDDAFPPQGATFEEDSATSEWTVSYSANRYPPGQYEVQVTVERWTLVLWLSITSGRAYFNITRLLNGNMELGQNNTIISTEYVSSTIPVTHDIKLSLDDYDFLEKNATSILTYWFVDCQYYGASDNFTFTHKYNMSDETHNIDALVVASFEPIPPPTTLPPPTTSTTSTTTPKPTTTSSTTTPKPPTTSINPSSASSSKSPVVKRDTLLQKSSSSSSPLLLMSNESKAMFDFLNTTLQIPFSCLNDSVIPMDTNKTYGYFHRKIIVKDPIANISISGNNWLQHEDMLMLQVRCRGSPPYEYCIHFHQGQYNVTGNETCRGNVLPTQTCEFPVVHYFNNVDIHTVVIIISNSVTKIVSPVTVRFYEVVTKAQLSVIVVPISFSIIAAILIVFGVAYYIQNRARFTVEVADFNFGQQYADLEYKTFGERLRESFNNALHLGNAQEAGDSPNPGWPGNDNNKYGTMT